jgi:hypothetical protein
MSNMMLQYNVMLLFDHILCSLACISVPAILLCISVIWSALRITNMRPPVHLIVWVLVAAELNSSGAFHCNRDPEDVQSPKSVNTHFHLRIAGNPKKYVPGGVYTGIKLWSLYFWLMLECYKVQQDPAAEPPGSLCIVSLARTNMHNICDEIQCET